MERAENYARFLDVNHQLMLDTQESGSDLWMPLIYTTGDHEKFLKKYGKGGAGNVIQFLTFDTENPNSIFSCLARARENARTIRENISTTMWEVLNEFYLEMKSIRKDYALIPIEEVTWNTAFDSIAGKNLYELFRKIRNHCQMFYGTTDSTVDHDEVWDFAMIGRYLERADKTTRILDMKYFILLPNYQDKDSTLDLLQWISLLKSSSAHEMYNRNYPKVVPLHIAQFLIQNPRFPRSIQFCLEEIQKSVNRLYFDPTATGGAPKDLREVLQNFLDFNQKTSLQDVFRSGFHEYIDDLQLRLNELGACIHETYFDV